MTNKTSLINGCNDFENIIIVDQLFVFSFQAESDISSSLSLHEATAEQKEEAERLKNKGEILPLSQLSE